MIDDTYKSLKTLPKLERKALTIQVHEVCELNMAFQEGWLVEHMCPFPSTDDAGPILVILKRERHE